MVVIRHTLLHPKFLNIGKFSGSAFEVCVFIIFAGEVMFEMTVWGFEKYLKLLDVMEWKWEEGSLYNDFVAQREEYTGPSFMTDFG